MPVKSFSLDFVAFLQAAGVFIYCFAVGLLIYNGNRLFGPRPTLLAPIATISLFAVSAIICTLIFLAYPFVLIWEHRQTKTALTLVLSSTAWLAALVVALLVTLMLFR